MYEGLYIYVSHSEEEGYV